MIAHWALALANTGERATAILIACCSETDVGTPGVCVKCATSGAGVPYAGYGSGVPPVDGSGAGVGRITDWSGVGCANPSAGIPAASKTAAEMARVTLGFFIILTVWRVWSRSERAQP